MKKINIYPIYSSLVDNEFINNQRNKLFLELKTLLKNYEFNITTINELYNSDLSIILIESGGSENEFLKVMDKLKEPYIFLTYNQNNSLAAGLEILTYLKNNLKQGEIIHGSSKYIASRIHELVSKNTKNTNIINDYIKLGVIGTPSDWLISCKVDESTLQDKFNIQLVNISIDELIENYNQLDKKDIEIPSNILNLRFNEDEIIKAYKIYLSIKNIVNKYNLKGFTIRCFDLLSTIKSTSCLALALLNDEGIIGTCEGDIPALISMYLIRSILNKPSFQANPSEIDILNNELIIAHCTLPLSMTTSYKLDTHYESKIGIGIKGELDLKDCFIFRINSSFNKFIILKGRIIENLNKSTLCRTQIKIKLDNNIRYFLTNPLGNHHMVVYGDFKELKDYLISKGLEEVK